MLGDEREQRVPAGGDQADERRLEGDGVLAGQEVGCDVALQVVDGRERQPPAGRQGLAGREADEQRADEARALRGGDKVDVAQLCARVQQGAVDDGVDELEVVARGDLRDDAAETVVDVL